jgi:archaellum biogenesis ATPase FlaH
MMSAKAPKQIRSGIEPVDKLLGGLESGQLFLVHGDASGKVALRNQVPYRRTEARRKTAHSSFVTHPKMRFEGSRG